jgi:L-threonate 2-dehydrogenase
MADAQEQGAGVPGTVGIIGLGIMGGAMAGNLRAGGWRVIGHDIDPNAMQAASDKGVETVAAAAEVAARVSDIITSLPSAEAALRTAEAIAAAAPSRSVVLEMSTLALEDKDAFAAVLEAKGHIALDCPLSGTGAQAQNKDLVVYASGNSAEIERLAPVFLGVGRR